TGAARSTWQRISHGFQLGGSLQYYSALPLNVVSGVNTIQQTAGRPCAGLAATDPQCSIGTMIGRNSDVGFDYVTLKLRLSRTFPLGERLKMQALAEAFNTLNHRNDMIPNATFGSAVYPTAPRSTFGQPTAVGDPRSVQVALRMTF